ncbi:siphovirus ReqiPepy6 Gp37-like family protein [Pseudoglutamicibacter cumminsii]|uniref:siphovirus ReqiPepy6 Gp37-like family protein n=1 Tax=Pseudoglutamicibacter cumminsii TaxID=156979 RepID=UPI0021A2CAFD|nr:siphovirus ReqiPepy6 Gp37-like family protein [Pseudoglutamicibacter cumminsii]MCT1686291.1 siphovirus ReqiPepy6 Gp37-like family protein [Pseudoglutamicibacter cumminsii]
MALSVYTDYVVAHIYTLGSGNYLTPRGRFPVITATVNLARNDVSAFEFTVDPTQSGWSRLDTTTHIALYHRGQQLVAGVPVELEQSWEHGVTELRVAAVSHMVYLRDRVTVPNPARALTAQDTNAEYKLSGSALNVVGQMVRAQVSTTAPRAEYRSPLWVPGLASGGERVTVRARYKGVLDEVQRIAALSPGLTASTQVTETTNSRPRVAFTVAYGRDLARAIRFTEATGGVLSYTLTRSAPEVTDVIVAGQGEGTARTIRHITGDHKTWGRRVFVFQDRRDTDDPTELDQAGTETLTEGQATSAMSVQVTDTEQIQYGRDYQIGDTVTIQTSAGAITDILEAAELRFDHSGLDIRLHVGAKPGAPAGAEWVPTVAKLARAFTTLTTQ